MPPNLNPANDSRPIDCGIIVALPEETAGTSAIGGFESIFELNGSAEPFGVEQVRRFVFKDRLGETRRGVLVILHAMGPARALAVTLRTIESFNPTVMINVGLAGTLSSEMRLGDLIVGEFSDQYSYRAKAVTGDIAFGGRPFSSYFPFYNASQQFPLSHPDDYWRFQTACSHMLGRALSAHEHQSLIAASLISTRPSLKGGPLACGDNVVAATWFRRKLLDHNRTFLAVDMESAGFLEACLEQRIERPRLVLRAISDFADEKKEQLDRINAGALRAWAMSNAFNLLSLLLAKVCTFERIEASPAAVPITGRFGALKSQLRSLISEKFLKRRYRLPTFQTEKDFDLYDRLLRPITNTSCAIDGGNIIGELARCIVNSDNTFPLRIDGRPGTGKSTMLNLLYLWMSMLHERDTRLPLPVYLNLRYYEQYPFMEGRPEAARKFEEDIQPLKSILVEFPTQRIVMLIDGIDEYVKVDNVLEDRLLEFVNFGGVALQQVVGVGLSYISHKDRFKRDLPSLRTPQNTALMSGISFTSQNATQLLETLQLLQTNLPNDAVIAAVTQKAAAFGFSTVDLFTLSMLLHRVSVPEYRKAETLSAWYTVYCEEYLSRKGGTVAQAAELAFKYAIQPTPLRHDDLIGKPAWKLIHRHRTIKDFLVAYHVIRLLKSAASATSVRFESLNYVYPQRINTFCKELANASSETQVLVLDGVKRMFAEGGEHAKPHACYLAGRLTNPRLRPQVTGFLKDCMAQMADLIEEKERMLSAGDLLLARTIFISLAYLGDIGASDTYLEWLLRDKRWDDLNRGFHLEYYADIPFDPDKQMSHEDPMIPRNEIVAFPNTFRILRERIELHLNDKDYGLLSIEIHTLYSLAQHRHEAGRLQEVARQELMSLLPRLINNFNVARILKPYLQMVQINFSEPSFPAGRLAEKLYALKTEERKGWVTRGLALPRVESVAEHSYGCFLLALLYLPEENPEWDDYDKAEILRMLLIHDLAEAIVGDVVTCPR